MNSIDPPCSVCFFSEDQENDDYSELTGQLTEYHYYYHSLDYGAHPLRTEQQQELLEMRLQVVKLQEKKNILESKLSQCELENEALEAEKAVLIEERTDPRKFSRQGCDNGGKMPTDTVAKLVTDNLRLQVVADVMRKSFRKHTADIRRRSDEDKQTIKTLQRENTLLQQQLLDLSAHANTLCKGTAKPSSMDVSGYTSAKQEDRNQYITSGSSCYSLQRENKLQHHQQIIYKSARETCISKCGTAITSPLDESGRTYTDKEYILPTDASQPTNLDTSIQENKLFGAPCNGWIIAGLDIGANGDGVASERAVPKKPVRRDANNCDTKDIYAGGANRVTPWLRWVGKARVHSPRAA